MLGTKLGNIPARAHLLPVILLIAARLARRSQQEPMTASSVEDTTGKMPGTDTPFRPPSKYSTR
jgi:hypothetical protein